MLTNIRTVCESYRQRSRGDGKAKEVIVRSSLVLSVVSAIAMVHPQGVGNESLRREVSAIGGVILSGAALTVSQSCRGVSKALTEDKQVSRLERSYRRAARERQLRAVYEPESVVQRTPLGGDLAKVKNVFDLDPDYFEVYGTGVRDGLTTKTYVLEVGRIDNRSDLDRLRPQIATALGVEEEITFAWRADTGLEVEVPKRSELCVYPKARDWLGNNRHEVLIPLGVHSGQLVTMRLDDAHNGLLFIGTSGSGKTTSAKGAIEWMCARSPSSAVRFWFGEPQSEKAKLFRPEEWEGRSHICLPIAHSKIDVLRNMAATIAECQRRAKLFGREGVASLDEWNATQPEKLPRLIGFIDEIELLCDPGFASELEREAFVRMALIVNRLCRSQGGHFWLGPKSIAAAIGEDAFPLKLRRVLGYPICLKTATAADGMIALQAEDYEILARSAVHLPGKGAAIVRHRGQLMRVQMLAPEADSRDVAFATPAAGDPLEYLPIPSLAEIFGRYCNTAMPEDDRLRELLAAEGVSYDELLFAAKYGEREYKKRKAERTCGSAVSGDSKVREIEVSDRSPSKEESSSPKVSSRRTAPSRNFSPPSGSDAASAAPSSSSESIDLSPAERERLRKQYLSLRRSMSMTDALLIMADRDSVESAGFKEMRAKVDRVLYESLPTIVAEYDAESTDEDVMVEIWGHLKGRRREETLAQIRAARSLRDRYRQYQGSKQ